jgi:CRISPR-associated protein Cas2
VFNSLRNWGDHLQYSVFECQLNETDLVRCKQELSEIINHAQDQVLFINLGPAAGRGERVIEAIGQPYVLIDSPCLII